MKMDLLSMLKLTFHVGFDIQRDGVTNFIEQTFNKLLTKCGYQKQINQRNKCSSLRAPLLPTENTNGL